MTAKKKKDTLDVSDVSGGWNYRLMLHKDKFLGNWYSVHSVYYNQKGRATSWSETAVVCQGYPDLREVKVDFCYLTEALEKPVLDFDTGKEIKPNAVVHRKTRLQRQAKSVK